MFECAKVDKRLWIRHVETGELRYTPPDFIRLHDRNLMHELAAWATRRGELIIDDIIVFETKAPRKPGLRKRHSAAKEYDPIVYG